MSKYVIKNVDAVDGVACPCGTSKRIITRTENDLVSIHRVHICKEAKKHYHKTLTEFYIILSGEGEMELDDDIVPVSPGDVIMIPPMTRHVARGDFEIINVVCPPFDANDEFMVES